MAFLATAVFVDVNENGPYEANEPGINGVIGEGGSELAAWLTSRFGNVLGDTFSDGVGDDVAEVAAFFKDLLFRQKSKKSAGPAKVDAQFMAVALATYFTSSDLAGDVAADYGFHVTDTGIGTKIVNLGAKANAFGEPDNTNLTIMQLLLATNQLTDVQDDVLGLPTFMTPTATV